MSVKKKVIDTTHLSSEQFATLREAARNVFFFSKFIKVIHPIKGKVPFLLYPFQKATLKGFLQHRFNIVLKFRQAGITELISMFCLWYAMFHPNKNIVILSIKDRVAKKILRRIKFMYKNLPEYMRVRVINGRGEDIGTATELEFANGSMITSIPTTEDAGRSEAVSLFVIDEAAIIRWADRIWAALFPTLSTGGRAILNSTPYGVGNLFHKIWVNACSGGNDFNPIRLHWQMHPERDWDWYKSMREALGTRKTAQEIDGDFLASGNTVFDLTDIRSIEEMIAEIQPVQVREGGNLKIFELPDPYESYVIGCDISTGRASDYTAFSVQTRDGDEVAAYKGKIPIDRTTKLLLKYGKMYNNAVLAPESNDIGLGVAINIQNSGYRNLYYSKHLLRKKGQPKPAVDEIPGWYTTKKNRPIIIAELEEDIRNDTIKIKDNFFCQEAYTFIYDSRNRPVAMNKDKSESEDALDEQIYTDDSIFAKAITNFVRKQRNATNVVTPK